jgi:hypothetical protein
MDAELASIGYKFDPSRYTPPLGFSRLQALLSGKPNGRFFEIKTVHLPTFDGRFFHQTQISRHELEPRETFQVCLGQISLDSFQGESLRAFSFGGVLNTSIESDDLFCELTSTAPLFKLSEDPKVYGGVIADEILDLLAENLAKLSGHENELYTRLASHDPYNVFLATMISLQKRAEGVPSHLRRERYKKVVSELHRAIQTVQKTDGWDGRSPSLEDLLVEGGR